jgi:hypothetical protein
VKQDNEFRDSWVGQPEGEKLSGRRLWLPVWIEKGGGFTCGGRWDIVPIEMLVLEKREMEDSLVTRTASHSLVHFTVMTL